MNILEPTEPDPAWERKQMERLYRGILQRQQRQIDEMTAFVGAKRMTEGSGFAKRLFSVPFVRRFCKAAVVICVMTALSTVCLLSVEASRNFIFNALMKAKPSSISFKFNENTDQLTESNEILSYLPEGFFLDGNYTVDGEVLETYVNQAGKQIIFQINNAGSVEFSIDSEDGKFKELAINDVDVYLYESDGENDKNVLMWNMGDAVFSLNSDIGISELIKIAESVIK
jgi:hypothetical protein